MSNDLNLFDKPQGNVAPNKSVDAPEDKTTALTSTLANVGVLYKDWDQRSQKAVAALSLIKEITTPEQDEAAEKVLVRVRETYKLINDQRLDVTSKIDALKAFLMSPEKAISTDAKAKDSEYIRVRGLRNDFAQKQLEAQKEKERQAQLEKDRADEITAIKAEIQTRVHDGIIDAVYKMDQSIIAFLAEINLENFDEKVKRFNLTPRLNENVYGSFFDVAHLRRHLEQNVFDDLIAAIKGKFTFDFVNQKYVESATPIVEQHKAGLPALKTRLEELEELRKKDAAAAEAEEKRLAELAEQEQKEKAEKAQAEKDAHAATVEQAANHERLNSTFEQQIAAQSAAANLSGVQTKRIATITGDMSKIVEMLGNAMYLVMSNPEYPGIIKRKKGVEQFDESGRPIYQDWIEELLDLYANTSATPIEGITITEVVSTSARAKKA